MAKDLKTIFNNVLPHDEHWKIQLLSNWDAIIGNLKTKVHLEKIMHDTVILGVYDSCWMQELYLLSDVLLNNINEKLDLPRIKNLRFKKKGIQKQVIATRSFNQPKPRKIVVLTAREQKALKAVIDPELRTAMEEFLIRCYQEKE